MNLYDTNGFVFWSEQDIQTREMFVHSMVGKINATLVSMNQAFKMVRCEAPILTPKNLIDSGYGAGDIFSADWPFANLALRPETTMGSYAYAKHILSGYHDPKYKMPICVWQHGKSFRKEQDQPTKFMRLKEFYQLEFQILFSSSTANDYYPTIVKAVESQLNKMLHNCRSCASDRLPLYSAETTDIIFYEKGASDENTGMEICSISRRTDYGPNVSNVEVAIGTCRAVYCYNKL